jgi:hypothetical protein
MMLSHVNDYIYVMRRVELRRISKPNSQQVRSFAKGAVYCLISFAGPIIVSGFLFCR